MVVDGNLGQMVVLGSSSSLSLYTVVRRETAPRLAWRWGGNYHLPPYRNCSTVRLVRLVHDSNLPTFKPTQRIHTRTFDLLLTSISSFAKHYGDGRSVGRLTMDGWALIPQLGGS